MNLALKCLYIYFLILAATAIIGGAITRFNEAEWWFMSWLLSSAGLAEVVAMIDCSKGER